VPVKILLSDGALRGVPIMAGHHNVEFFYAPRSLQLGLLITSVATVAMLASFAAVAVCSGPTALRGLRTRDSELS